MLASVDQRGICFFEPKDEKGVALERDFSKIRDRRLAGFLDLVARTSRWSKDQTTVLTAYQSTAA